MRERERELKKNPITRFTSTRDNMQFDNATYRQRMLVRIHRNIKTTHMSYFFVTPSIPDHQSDKTPEILGLLKYHMLLGVTITLYTDISSLHDSVIVYVFPVIFNPKSVCFVCS
jgi:hypothetical protein